jgi:REP element-mobilizing transposase RayT
MARQQRMYSERGMYFVTARTFQARMLLTPAPGINDVIGGALARAAALTGVELHGFVAASNHVHLLVTAKGASLSNFMQQFLGNASRKVGRLTHWSGSLWQRRFSAAPVLDDAAALGRLQYILAHGVKEGLVRHPAEWPGLSCLQLLLDGGSQTHRFFHWSRRWKKGVLLEGGDNLLDARWAEEVVLMLTPLPCWVGLTHQQRRTQVQDMVKRIVDEGAAAHETVLGAKAVASQNPQRRPSHFKKSPRPQCHASARSARQAYRAATAAWTAAYASASSQFRKGVWGVEFPPWACRPHVPYGVCGT